MKPMGGVVSAAVGGTVSLLGTLGTLVMVPVFAFYFLHDFDRIMALLRDLLPLSIRDDVVFTAQQIDRVLSDFVRGQLTVMGIMAGLYAFGYMLIGVPLAVPIGVLAGFLTFVPYVGSAVALVFGLLMVVLHFTGIGKLIAVVVVYVVIQTLDGILITPRVVGGRLGLSPVWVLFALTAFGQLFGFVGVMLALPASAVMKVFVVEAIERYRKTSWYLGFTPVQRVSQAPVTATGAYPPSRVSGGYPSVVPRMAPGFVAGVPPRAARLRSRPRRRDRVRVPQRPPSVG
jgi:predicted PurR-regulated permease PerM